MTGQVVGKVALVTGATSGIGRAIAELLAQEGASVVLTGLNAERGAQIVASMTKESRKAIFLTQDVTSETRWSEVVSEIDRHYGRLDVLVSNAGIGIGAPIVDTSLEDWRRQVAVNLDGVFLSVKHCLPLMRRNGGGSVILMSSTTGLFGGGRGFACYSATKGGVRLFAKAVALECAQAGDGVRVNSLHPGNTVTPIHRKMLGQAFDADENGVIVKLEEHSRQVVPLGRSGQPREIAQGALFLASDASSYITGTELIIDGGRSAGPFYRP